MKPSVEASLRGADDAGALGAGKSIRGSAEADLDRICDRSAEGTSLADLWLTGIGLAEFCSSERAEELRENGRCGESGVLLSLPTLGRKGFAEAIITFDG